jgi:hypothetical protein
MRSSSGEILTPTFMSRRLPSWSEGRIGICVGLLRLVNFSDSRSLQVNFWDVGGKARSYHSQVTA